MVLGLKKFEEHYIKYMSRWISNINCRLLSSIMNQNGMTECWNTLTTIKSNLSVNLKSVYRRFANRTPLRRNRQSVLTPWCLYGSPRPKMIIAAWLYKWGWLSILFSSVKRNSSNCMSGPTEDPELQSPTNSYRSYKKGKFMKWDHFIRLSSHAADWWNRLLHCLLLAFMRCEIEAKWAPRKLDCSTLRILCLL